MHAYMYIHTCIQILTQKALIDDKKLVVWDLRAPAHKPAAAHVISGVSTKISNCRY